MPRYGGVSVEIVDWKNAVGMERVTPTACISLVTRSEARQTRALTLSPPIPLRLETLSYWSNPPFLISDIQALWRSVLSARAPECQKLKNSGLDQYGAEHFEQQQFGTAGAERVNSTRDSRFTANLPVKAQIEHSLRAVGYGVKD